MKRDARNIIGVSFKGHHRVWIRRFNVEELDIGVAGGSEIAFVGGDAETIDLGVGMLKRTRTDAG